MIEVIAGFIEIIAGIAVASLLLWIPLAFFRRTRSLAGVAILITSYCAGASVWIWAAEMAYRLAGIIWLLIGVLLFGVGVVAVAIVAAFLNGAASISFLLIGYVAFVWILRSAGLWLVNQAEEDAAEIENARRRAEYGIQ